MTAALRYGELPASFGAAIRDAHAGCAATVATAREAWRVSGDDAVYRRATLDAITDADRALGACMQGTRRTSSALLAP